MRPFRRQLSRGWSCGAALVLVGLAAGAGGQTLVEELPDAPGTQSAAGGPVRGMGAVEGVVTDPTGAVVPGAEVRLLDATGDDSRRTITGADGRYRLEHVPAGRFTLTVTREGFQGATGTGELDPDERFEVAPLTLRPATVETAVTAMTMEEVAEEQIHLQEQQRLLRVLPNFFVSYDWNAVPLRPRQKFQLAWRNAIDPGNMFVAGVTAGIQQAMNSFPGYGQGVAGYGRRLGANYGNIVSGTFLGGAVFPTLFHQDPRFFYKADGTVKQKLWYGVTRAVVQRGDNGRWQPAYSSIAGDFAAGALSNAYYAPEDRQGVGLTVKNAALGVLGDAVNGFFQEMVLPYFTSRGKLKPPPTP